ncbi:polyprenyl diphosphate synthase, partial [Patescibacteria group bacterium]|nr:polyprenyl diphosphate synthase [Patescibacteria group bacterium]
MAEKKQKKIPAHIGIIMDGNRRWAAKHGLGVVDGHRVAAKETIEPVVERASQLGVKYLTFWAFSTENWKRDQVEVRGVMQLFREVIADSIDRLNKKGVRLRILGDLSRFPKDIIKLAEDGVKKTAQNKLITVALALNYGGRDELVRSVKKIVKSKVSVGKINEKLISSCLDTAGMPDPDLIIRTGGACRLSGFLPWQSVYAEFYFTSLF